MYIVQWMGKNRLPQKMPNGHTEEEEGEMEGPRGRRKHAVEWKPVRMLEEANN